MRTTRYCLTAMAAGILLATGASTQSAKNDRSPGRLDTIAHKKGSPIFGLNIPPDTATGG